MPNTVDSFTARLDLMLKHDDAAQAVPQRPPRPARPAADVAAPRTPNEPVGADRCAERLNDSADKTDARTRDATPVGAGAYVVQEIDCLSRIAAEHGHLVETIWNDPANADLRAARQNPEVLLRGDGVHVPPLRPRSEPGATEQRHRFVRHGRPSRLRLVLRHNDRPRAGEPYSLRVENLRFEGVTDPEGKIEHPIPPEARRAVLEIGAAPNVETHEIQIGRLDPIAALSGVQQRLTNLGFSCGALDGAADPQTTRALRAYQRRHDLPATGQPDDATRAKLLEEHGS